MSNIGRLILMSSNDNRSWLYKFSHMNYRRELIKIIITIVILSCIIGCKERADTQISKDYKYKVGQIWNYDNRPGEENSTIKILKIDKYEKPMDSKF